MGLIKKINELNISTSIKMMIYGQAGMRKTTTALSAPSPLLLDFDNGVKRVNIAHLDGVDIVQVNSWKEVNGLLNEDLTPYKTIVIDTIGKMMDFIISYKCESRQPLIRDWSNINLEFTRFMKKITDLNKNIIFVAHRDTRKEGDNIVFIPALREKTYNAIVTELDLLGYMEARNENGRTRCSITFDPTERNDGKNTCNLPSTMEVPTILDNSGFPIAKNEFISRSIIPPYLEMLNKKKEQNDKYYELIDNIKENIALITDAASANDFSRRIKEFNHIGTSLQKARQLFLDKVKELGLVFDKKENIYHDAD